MEIKRSGEQQASRSHLCAWQDYGADPPGKCVRYEENQELSGDSQDGFIKGK